MMKCEKKYDFTFLKLKRTAVYYLYMFSRMNRADFHLRRAYIRNETTERVKLLREILKMYFLFKCIQNIKSMLSFVRGTCQYQKKFWTRPVYALNEKLISKSV